MTAPLALAIGCFILACIPAVIFAVNFREFGRLPRRTGAAQQVLPPVSVLIPARNEERSIERAVNSVLTNSGVAFELIVLDDHSTDDTAAIVRAIAQQDDRVRVMPAPPLPAGWCGKQHACQVLAELARYDTLLWIDADVRLASDALERMALELGRNQAALISGFPFQRTDTWVEALLIPLIHFILLGFLPLPLMRRDPSPALGAGCGQLFMANRKDYFAAGGHAAIRQSLHDGITLPRAFRKANKRTDLFDARDLADCRMYDSSRAVWNGLLKNAGEGIATPAGILPWTVLLFGGQVLPWCLAVYFIASRHGGLIALLLVGMAATSGILVRLLSAQRFYEQSSRTAKYLSAIFHPLGVLIFLAIQWHALARRLAGRRSIWKGRSY